MSPLRREGPDEHIAQAHTLRLMLIVVNIHQSSLHIFGFPEFGFVKQGFRECLSKLGTVNNLIPDPFFPPAHARQSIACTIVMINNNSNSNIIIIVEIIIISYDYVRGLIVHKNPCPGLLRTVILSRVLSDC